MESLIYFNWRKMMALEKHYPTKQKELIYAAFWETEGVYHFEPDANKPVYSIDTPPPTVSGKLHLGHVYSYSHADFMARFHRMQGENVFYPMGYDDNGLPTERLVEKKLGIRGNQLNREAFIQKCLEISAETEKEYQQLWQRLGLSIDWRYTYRTNDNSSRRIAQQSFLDLFSQNLIYQEKAPAIWCPECHTSLAQADLNDLERETEFVNIRFKLESGEDLIIATTRPELLAACVAIFVHPEDERFLKHIGKTAFVPIYQQKVPILADPRADPNKGSGAVMCCTFGDQMDVIWWQQHHLPLIEIIQPDGNLAEIAGDLTGMPVAKARKLIKQILSDQGHQIDRQPCNQSIRVHERCDTAVEWILTHQWFLQILPQKQTFLELGKQINWYPTHMSARYQTWVENLSWDWCISRQRFFGVPIPVWNCSACGKHKLASADQLPVNPLLDAPQTPCTCGNTNFEPETDVLDTWFTSSTSPQIIGRWLEDENLFRQVFPASLRPQAHEIIRTWAFYTIVKSHYLHRQLPWKNILISGWGLAGEGMGKISKSRGGGSVAPIEMLNRYSADALRYWAASTVTGKDAIINEEKFQNGTKLVTKLWNVARFCEPFLQTPIPMLEPSAYSPVDRWILAECQVMVETCTEYFENYDYAQAKNTVENFFWHILADNYLEMAKFRLYDNTHSGHDTARSVLKQVFLTVLQILAPILPFITESIYQILFAGEAGGTLDSSSATIHRSLWPKVDALWKDDEILLFGSALLETITKVRRYKSEHNLGLGAVIDHLCLSCQNLQHLHLFTLAMTDLKSVTRATKIEILEKSQEDADVSTESISIQIITCA
ncbi:MAG: valine--tRNA ligase [Chloroflexi bacterium HGW-Chloroflexi-10]|nr:MAG: valine--tRNA ligase [Chloroflexi bacterium HGW-Chloroflexi-10]